MSSLGNILQEARKKKGVSQEIAAKLLKIKLERLRDLEEGRYDQFPAYVYVRSFLRHYTHYLDLDTEALLKQFAEENPPPTSKPIFEITEEQRTRSPIQRHVPAQSSLFLTRTGKTVLAAALIILILAAVSLWWVTSRQNTISEPSPNSAAHPSGLELSAPPSPPSDPHENWPSQPLMTTVPAPSMGLSTNAMSAEPRHAP